LGKGVGVRGMTVQELQEINLGNISIPGKFLTKCCSILAKRGSGKTYLAGVLEEELAKAEYPFVVIDPMGAHWGIREVYPVVIFGGPHGDIEIEPHDAALIAEVIVKQNVTCILDMVEWDQDTAREFVAAFADKLYQLNSSPRHVIIEEADIFAPQSGGSGAAKLAFKSIDNLVRRGRGKGIGVTTITQRPAIIHKNIISQADVSIILNLQANRDLQAVVEMLDDDGFDSHQRKEVLSKIKRFTQGQALIYSPQWLKLTEPIRIRQRESFHAGAEPEYGVKPPVVKLVRVTSKKRKIIALMNKLTKVDELPESEIPEEKVEDGGIDNQSLMGIKYKYMFVTVGVVVGVVLYL
jgi:hypothetical protein